MHHWRQFGFAGREPRRRAGRPDLDGNIASLISNFVYDKERSRSVSVHAGAIIEVLRKVYDAGALADVLEGKVAVSAP